MPPGRLREISVVSLLSNPRVARLGARIAGLCRETVRGPRAVGGFCSRTLPSGRPTALGQEGPSH